MNFDLLNQHNRDNDRRYNRRKTMDSTGYELSQEHPNYITLLIIDESGSMAGLRNATIESFNGMVGSILTDAREIPNLVQHMNVYTFEGSTITERLALTTVRANAEIQSLEYHPGGSTPLFDAMGTVITKLENIIHAEKISDDTIKVSVAIFTDGAENSSREYSLQEIQRMITRLKIKGWEFSYFGTEHSVEEMATQLHMDKVQRFQKTKSGLKETMASYSRENSMSKHSFYDKFGKY